MAEAVAQGSSEVEDTEVILKPAKEATIEEVESSDALIVGSPVHMGSPDWEIKKFIDEICAPLWMKDKMNGKVCGVFATGGGFGGGGGGNEITMLALLNNFAELGLIIIPLPKNTPGYKHGGLQWGPYGRTLGLNMEKKGLEDFETEAAKHHGKHVARAAKIIKGQKIFGE